MTSPTFNVRLYLLLLLFTSAASVYAQPLTTAGLPAQLAIRPAGAHSIRITLKPLSFAVDYPATPALVERIMPAPVIVLTELSGPIKKKIGDLLVEVRPNPLTITVTSGKGAPIQQLVFRERKARDFLLPVPSFRVCMICWFSTPMIRQLL